MEMLYTFEGIKAVDGTCPRALVVGLFPVEQLPEELANVRITISLPINDLGLPLAVIAQRVLSTARLLVNESAAVQWVKEQPLGLAHPELTNPPGRQRYPIDEEPGPAPDGDGQTQA